ncbi:MAG: alpha/beta hydrolase [Tabrizicola sp.]|jgi:hypothetical protein|nr:alpha/beta hydrolase [Tabrizicola sp.]
MGMVRKGLILLALMYALAVAALYLGQRQLVFDPSQRAPAPEEAGFAGATEHVLTAADGTRVRLWHAPAPRGSATILYFQGKGGEIADRPQRWAAYRAAGFGVAFLSYRGYGGSEGEPSEAGLHLDADAAYGWLLEQGVSPDRLVLVGESLGTGVATRLAADQAVAALILEAPYTSLIDIAALRFPLVPARLLMRDPFPSLDRMPGVKAPVLILHGTDDSRVPPAMGERLFHAASGPKELALIPGRGHVDLFGPDLWAREVDFLHRVFNGPPR